MKNLIKISFLTITLSVFSPAKHSIFHTGIWKKKEKDIQIKKVIISERLEILKILMEEPKRRKTVQKRPSI
jgi:hypothetical protein